jgi:hypothetical protein
MPEKLEVPPDPTRMIEGLRDTGYQFNTAVADLIDNSIAANASIIDVSVAMDFRGNITVSICDDGIGMNKPSLITAMKYGSPPRPDPSSLGKFGLGLKTASTAFCRRLSVISRAESEEPLVKATWDLDHVAREKKWELLLSEPSKEEIQRIEQFARNSSGTLVQWEKVDRLLKLYQDPGGNFARNALEKHVDSLKEHVAMVYQRFLDPNDKRARTLTIRVNTQKMKAWDPFCVGVSELVADETKQVEINGKKSGTFTVKAYVLPRKEEFKSSALASEAKIGNAFQGIYVYRENRLIHGPEWLGMFTKEPHGSLLRVEFSFGHQLDDAFHIDIKKSQVILNEDLYNWFIEELLPAPRRAADDRYRKGQKKKVEEQSKTAHDSSNANIQSKEPDLETPSVQVLNESKGEVLIDNRMGQVRLKLTISRPTKPGEFFVQPVESLPDGVLWAPAMIGTHKAVQINTNHPYYHKVYIPNLMSGVTIQGMDSLLWALCIAELNTVSEATKNHFIELRYEVSKLLRRLVEDLPEPETGDEVVAVKG